MRSKVCLTDILVKSETLIHRAFERILLINLQRLPIAATSVFSPLRLYFSCTFLLFGRYFSLKKHIFLYLQHLVLFLLYNYLCSRNNSLMNKLSSFLHLFIKNETQQTHYSFVFLIPFILGFPLRYYLNIIKL